MATPIPYEPVQFFFGLLWSDKASRDRALAAAQELWGPIESPWGPVPFTYTDYYDAEMGEGIRREFHAIRNLRQPDALADDKLSAIRLEIESSAGSGRNRSVNLDPGFLDRFKLVLASAKNGPNRIPLGKGIYGEVTMLFRAGEFEPHRLTYRDYASDVVRTYFGELRRDYLEKLRNASR